LEAVAREISNDRYVDVSTVVRGSFLDGMLNQGISALWTSWDNLSDTRFSTTNKEYAAYQRLLMSDGSFLHPSLIRDKYTFFGAIADSTQAELWKSNSFDIMPGLTVLNRGPAEVSNVFGTKKTGIGYRRFVDDYQNKFIIGEQEKLYMVITDSMMNIKVRNISINPYVVVPQTVMIPEQLTTLMNNGSLPAHHHGDVNTAVNVRKGEDRSWFIGRIQHVEPNGSMTDSDYALGMGIKSYSVHSHMRDVYAIRTAVRKVTINLRTL